MEEKPRRKEEIGVWYPTGHWPDRNQEVSWPLDRSRKGGGGAYLMRKEIVVFLIMRPLCLSLLFRFRLILFFKE